MVEVGKALRERNQWHRKRTMAEGRK